MFSSARWANWWPSASFSRGCCFNILRWAFSPRSLRQRTQTSSRAASWVKGLLECKFEPMTCALFVKVFEAMITAQDWLAAQLTAKVQTRDHIATFCNLASGQNKCQQSRPSENAKYWTYKHKNNCFSKITQQKWTKLKFLAATYITKILLQIFY